MRAIGLVRGRSFAVAAGAAGRRRDGLSRRCSRVVPGARVRRGLRDAVVVGGGVVGAACTGAGEVRAGRRAGRGAPAALGRGAARPARGTPSRPRTTPRAARCARRVEIDPRSPRRTYRRMRVWTGKAAANLAIDADALGRRELGWIVEHGLLVDRLGGVARGRGRSDARRSSKPSRRTRMAFDSGWIRAACWKRDRRGRRWRRFRVTRARRHPGRCARLSATRRGRLCRNRIVRTKAPPGSGSCQRAVAGPFCPMTAMALSSIVWSLPEDEAARMLALDDRRSTKRSPMRSTPGGDAGRLEARCVPVRRQLTFNANARAACSWPATPRTWSIRWRDRA